MLEFIISKGWTVDFTSQDMPPGFIEFRHKCRCRDHLSFWRMTIREAAEYLGFK